MTRLKFTSLASLFGGVCVAVLLGLPALAQDSPIVIGTGPVAGTYFPAGGAICRAYERAGGGSTPSCLVQVTAGSRDNLERLLRGEIDFALVQSDWQYLALNGGQFEGAAKVAGLRAVLSLHAHAMAIVVGPDSGIADFNGLKGRQVNLGPSLTGARAAAESLIGVLGWPRDALDEISELPPGEVAAALCEGRIDAFLMPVSHPDAVVAAAVNQCGAKLLDVPASAIEGITGDWRFYSPTRLQPGVYPGQDNPVLSYGLRATLVTTQAVSPDRVFDLTKAVLSKLEDFKGQHPVLAGLAREDVQGAGAVFEIHEGAARYFRGTGG